MELISLQSGSNGNCIYVETKGVRLFFDAGISGQQAKERLATHGKCAVGADALFLSHDHSDHVRCAGVMARKFGIPIYANQRTLAAARRRAGIGEIKDIQHFRSGDSVRIGAVTVHTIATPHDAADGVVFVVDDGEQKLGICTDVGHVFADLEAIVRDVDGLFLESNYDEAMLELGDYPMSLKRRIRGGRGHISNVAAAELVSANATSRLQWLCIAHLSQENNTPTVAMATQRAALGPDLPIHIAGRYGVSPVHRLGRRAGATAVAQPVAPQPLKQPKAPSWTQGELFFTFPAME